MTIKQFSSLECFDMFNIDMGASIIDSRIGPPTKDETKLLGKDLWETKIVKKEKQINEKSLTIDQMRKIAKDERKERADIIAMFVADGGTIDEAIQDLGPPLFQGWEERE